MNGWNRNRAPKSVGLVACLIAFWLLFSASKPAVLNLGSRTGFVPSPKFIPSLARDLQGNIWAGSEGEGIFRFDVSANSWKRFGAKDGLGDEFCYAIAADHAGRIWAGHQGHGVSVYDGSKWQNYEPVGRTRSPNSPSGPLGGRVFAIKVSPLDGDVWIATDAGLTRYSEKSDSWSYFAAADPGAPGPNGHIKAMDFDGEGNLYLGTESEGLVIGNAKDNYKTWRSIPGPEKPPIYAFGAGLPGNMINDVLVAKDGTVYVGTTNGLAWSKDKGESWQYIRGQDWLDKAHGLYPTPSDVIEESHATLSEDYITCLAEGADGQLWIGHRKTGCERTSPQFGVRLNRTLAAAAWTSQT